MSRWRKPLVQHQVNEDSGNRHVQPDGDRPTRDSLVPVPSATKNRNKRQNDQRQRRKRQQNVRGEDRKVNRRDPAGVSGRFLANARMISDVADQKKNRREEGCDHTRHVTAPRAAPDEVPTCGNKNRAHEIKRGIEGWQVGG